MGSVFLTNLRTGWHVDQAILSEDEKVVIIRFGHTATAGCMATDELLYKISDRVKNFATIYVVDIDEVKDFNAMYELYDESGFGVMFFWRNKHMQVDFGTGNNNKLNFPVGEKQELIDIVECVYKGAKKGLGLVVSPKDYSTTWKY